MTNLSDDRNKVGPASIAKSKNSVYWNAARIVAMAGFPASLLSAGATVSLAAVSLFGLGTLMRDRDFPSDLKYVHRLFFSLYLLVVLVEVLNGGSIGEIGSTAFNYLPLPALALYAYSLRKLELGPPILDGLICITLIAGAAISVGIALTIQSYRPGGLDMDALSYGCVLAIWLLFVVSRALESARLSIFFLSSAGFAVAVLFYAQTKIVIAAVLVGFVCIGLVWVVQNGRWLVFVAVATVTLILLSWVIGQLSLERYANLWTSVEIYIHEGRITQDGSFGIRMEQVVAGWQAFLDKPLLGHGLSSVHSAVLEYFASQDPAWRSIRIHNDYIVHMVAFGALGLVFLAGYLIVAFIAMNAAGDPAYRRAGLALVVTMPMMMSAYIIFNMSPVSGAVTLAMGAVLSVPMRARLGTGHNT
ncbi:MAG: O-antigen ligase family protein [Rhizobiaceae bacterium]|nr:O-antigen ligase family protein [Rhizobiaceae bacterium]